MRIRPVCVLLLVGAVCLGTTIADESASSLLEKGRQAFKTANYDDAERYDRLAIVVSEHGDDATQFAEALGDLGGVLLAKGQYAESKRLCLKALGILRSTQTKPYLPVVLNNLSQLSRLAGDHVQEERYLKESLQVAQALNPHDPYLARVLNNLGVVYFTTGDSGHAEKTFKKAIEFVETELGRDRAELAPILNNLGGVYVVRKKWDVAAPLFYRALSLLKNSGNFSGVANVLDSVGAMYYARDNVPEAERAFRQAYKIWQEVFGARHPKVAGTALNLAATLTKQGQYAEAERLYASALQIYENALGSGASEVASTLVQTAELLRKTNRAEAAGKLEAWAESIRFELEHVVSVEQLH